MARDKYIEIGRQFVATLEDLLKVGDWEASLFLRVAQKKLQELRDEAIAISEDLAEAAKEKDEHAGKERQGYIKVYISIYQSDSHNLVKWQNTLKGISEYSVSRPIYRNEEHIQEMIRSKRSPNEAYATVYIKESDIISPYTGKIIEDRWGHELLTIRGGTLLPANIVEFIHNDKKYTFKNGKLLVTI
jgi:intracellular multiplication protein IcmQ